MPTAIAHTVEASFAALTPTAKRIASYMLANLERLGLETADQIAPQTGTSGISVGRFLRSVGHRNLDEPKRDLRGAQTWPWFITDRLDARRGECLDGYAHGVEKTCDTARSLSRSMRFVMCTSLHEATHSPASRSALQPRMASFSAFNRRAPFRMRSTATLNHLWPRAFTDLYCQWARDCACDLPQVKTDVGRFRDSLAPLTCLFNLLIASIVERLCCTIDRRVARNCELQCELDQFDL
ncbi:hypothetical protein OKW32_007883 [Paraburkholderia youngii]